MIRSSMKAIRREGFKNLVRYVSDDGCSPCKPPCPCPLPPTTEPCPKPQPCPPPPPLPQGRCYPDVFNPCKWRPPPCPDPDYPDLTKLKRLQCHYQKDDGNVIWLKGPYDKLLFQVAIVLTVGSVFHSFYILYQIIVTS